MRINEASANPCPAHIVALAANTDREAQHCGIIYTNAGGEVKFCDFQWEDKLEVRSVPGHYIWAKVALDEHEALQIAVFVDLVATLRQPPAATPYSFQYAQDSFDAFGTLRAGAGLTCATFIVGVFERFKFFIVDLASWKARVGPDSRFRDRIIRLAEEGGYPEVANRLRGETPNFRLKPWELCSGATHRRYPVKFRQAIKLTKTFSKLVRKKSRNSRD